MDVKEDIYFIANESKIGMRLVGFLCKQVICEDIEVVIQICLKAMLAKALKAKDKTLTLEQFDLDLKACVQKIESTNETKMLAKTRVVGMNVGGCEYDCQAYSTYYEVAVSFHARVREISLAMNEHVGLFCMSDLVDAPADLDKLPKIDKDILKGNFNARTLANVNLVDCRVQDAQVITY
jgi:hypothetical protein